MKPLLLLVIVLIASISSGIGLQGRVASSAPPVAKIQPNVPSPPVKASFASLTPGAILSIIPQTNIVELGEVFEMQLIIDSEDQKVSGLQAFIDFDPTVLEVQDANPNKEGIQVEDGVMLPIVLANKSDNQLGHIDYIAAKIGEPFPDGNFVVATITFKVVGTTPPSGIDLSFSFTQERETLVDFGGNPILDEAIGATVIVGSGIQQADLSVSEVDEPDPVFAGAQLTYIVNLENRGPSDATEVTLVDMLAGGVEFVSAVSSQGGCSEENGAVTCTIGTLSNNTAATITIRANVGPTTAGTLLNIAVARSDTDDQDYSNNIAIENTRVSAPEADLAVIKLDDPDPAKVGNSLAYTIIVDNRGPFDATGVTVMDDLPPEVTFESASEGCAYHSVSHSVICDLGGLTVGASSTANIAVLPEATGLVSNSARVTGDQADSDIANNTAIQGTTIEPLALCMGQPATIIGTDNSDLLVGTPGADIIAGLGGNDSIFGLGGDDVVCAGAGDDLVSGGAGMDRIWGEAGNDIVVGGDGDDAILGGDGDDLLVGGGGADIVLGERGDDRLLGGNGNDLLIGGENNDSIDCGIGFDLAFGDLGIDTAAANCEITAGIP